MPEYFFTGDHHFFHKSIIKHTNRPFDSLEEMHEELIKRHNEVVSRGDVVVVAGDFSFAGKIKTYKEIIHRLNGQLIFLRGCHDGWLTSNHPDIWRKRIGNQVVVVCHYCLRTWFASHYNSWHLFAHSHGRLPPVGKSWDIGVDTNNFYPYSFTQIKEIMSTREDNFNLVRRRE